MVARCGERAKQQAEQKSKSRPGARGGSAVGTYSPAFAHGPRARASFFHAAFELMTPPPRSCHIHSTMVDGERAPEKAQKFT